MYTKNICYLICLLFLIVSCGDRRAERIREARKALEQYEASFPAYYKNLIDEYNNNNVPIVDETIRIKGCIFCLTNGIYQWKSLNDKLKKDGYKVTLSQDSLSYFIFTESISHNEGYYSNGGTATRIEKKVIALDVKEKIAYILKTDCGGMPPQSISRGRGSKTGAVGRSLTDDEIYNFLKNNILVK
ncbi:hypothetical protein [Phocaeicola vulgatus]|mgnify:FL=1|jgi:hypothetical protein|uniref:hypothetical protein n=1 Tax=Phocaeicola vulgatus TaxID=821 RepID=UPI001F304709|nr:hypothetical protein [Phocaeicola vulgatus]MCG0155254.1 hypothetical protein [Phocaeicola vulgatus]MCG0329190.1 hypothetical protein [Phocaeicola vulgatus]MCG0333075.1 hypothetical protein [Phocaeicola vulgatus]